MPNYANLWEKLGKLRPKVLNLQFFLKYLNLAHGFDYKTGTWQKTYNQYLAKLAGTREKRYKVPTWSLFWLISTGTVHLADLDELLNGWLRNFLFLCFREMISFVFHKIFLLFREICTKHEIQIQICVKFSRNLKEISRNTKQEITLTSFFKNSLPKWKNIIFLENPK